MRAQDGRNRPFLFPIAARITRSTSRLTERNLRTTLPFVGKNTCGEDTMRVISGACLAVVFALAPLGSALAQDSESARAAKELAAALDAAKVDAIAAKDPARAGTYVAALYFSGAQLLVISAQYSAPTLLDQKLAKKEYRDIYLDLYGAPMPGTKVFIEDFGPDGLKVKPENDSAPDSYEATGKRTAFDGKWDEQKLSESAYQQAFTAAGAAYTKMLTALIDQIKK
jgi:hypothetical protein